MIVKPIRKRNPMRDYEIHIGKDSSSTTLTRLYGNSFSSIASTSRAISTYSSNELSSVLFAAFIGCKTGLTDRTYGNLVDAALDKGVDCAIG